MSTGQKIRKLTGKVEKLNNELRDLEREHLENKEFQINLPKLQENNKPKSAIDEDIHYEEYIEKAENFCLCPQSFNCSLNPDLKLYKTYYSMKDVKKKIELYKIAIDAIIQQKDEEIRVYQITVENMIAEIEKLKQQKLKIDDKIIDAIKFFANPYNENLFYKDEYLSYWLKALLKQLLKQLGIEK